MERERTKGKKERGAKSIEARCARLRKPFSHSPIKNEASGIAYRNRMSESQMKRKFRKKVRFEKALRSIGSSHPALEKFSSLQTHSGNSTKTDSLFFGRSDII